MSTSSQHIPIPSFIPTLMYLMTSYSFNTYISLTTCSLRSRITGDSDPSLEIDQVLFNRIFLLIQEPVLFCGSIRFNLDPFNKHSDDELWTVMEVSHLKSFVSGLNDGLQHKITEGGENLR